MTNTDETTDKDFEVRFKNNRRPIYVRAEECVSVTTEEDQVIQFFRSGGDLLLKVYVRVLDVVSIIQTPISEPANRLL